MYGLGSKFFAEPTPLKLLAYTITSVIGSKVYLISCSDYSRLGKASEGRASPLTNLPLARARRDSDPAYLAFQGVDSDARTAFQ